MSQLSLKSHVSMPLLPDDHTTVLWATLPNGSIDNFQSDPIPSDWWKHIEHCFHEEATAHPSALLLPSIPSPTMPVSLSFELKVNIPSGNTAYVDNTKPSPSNK